MTNDRDARRSRLADAGAKTHRSHLLARIADSAVTSGQWFRDAEQSLTGRAAVRQYCAPQRGASESGSSLEVSPGQIQTGFMWNKISQMCCVAWAFLPNSTSPRTPHDGSNDSRRRVYLPLGCGALARRRRSCCLTIDKYTPPRLY